MSKLRGEVTPARGEAAVGPRGVVALEPDDAAEARVGVLGGSMAVPVRCLEGEEKESGLTDGKSSASGDRGPDLKGLLDT